MHLTRFYRCCRCLSLAHFPSTIYILLRDYYHSTLCLLVPTHPTPSNSRHEQLEEASGI